MIGRKAVIGLSLLCALLFSAFAAQSASAAKSLNTTAFTCVSSGGSTNKDFSDSHCDKGVVAGTGSFEHLAIANKTPTEVETTRTSPSAILKGEVVGGGKVTVTCTGVKNNVKNSVLTNTEPNGGEHTISGTSETEFSSCTVTELKNCTVKTPIFAKANVHGVEGLTGPNGEANAMGLEFTGSGASETFTELTFEGGSCAVKGIAFPVKGNVVATNGPEEKGNSVQNNKHSGTTLVFTPEAKMQNLQLSGKASTFTLTATAARSGGNPLSLTTTT